MTVGHFLQRADPAVAPSPALIMLRKVLPDLARQAHPDDRAAMTTFYEERRGPLLWVTETGLSDKGRAVISEVRKADDWGLHSSDFSVPQARAQLAPSPLRWALQGESQSKVDGADVATVASESL